MMKHTDAIKSSEWNVEGKRAIREVHVIVICARQQEKKGGGQGTQSNYANTTQHNTTQHNTTQHNTTTHMKLRCTKYWP